MESLANNSGCRFSLPDRTRLRDEVTPKPPRLLEGVLSSAVGKVWIVVTGIVMVPLYIRLLGIEAYGLVALFTSISTAFYLFDFGLSTALNRELAALSMHSGCVGKQRTVLRTTELIYWGIATAAGFGLIVVCPTLAHNWIRAEHLSPELVQRALVMMTLAITLQFPFSLYSGGMLGIQKQIPLNAFVVASSTIRAIGSLAVLSLYSSDLESFLGWQLISAGVQTFGLRYILWCYLLGTTVPCFDIAVFRRLKRFSAGVAGAGVLTIILSQIDKLILSKVLTLKEFAYYNVANLIATGMCMAAYPVCTTIFPRFVQLVAAKDDISLAGLYHLGCQAVAVLLVPTALVLAVFAKPIVLFWTKSPEIAGASSGITAVLAIGSALSALTCIPFALQLATGWTSYGVQQGLVSAIGFPIALIWMTHHYGVIGAAYTRLMLYFLQALVGLPVTHSRILSGHAFKWFWNDTTAPAAISLTIVLLSTLSSRSSTGPGNMLWIGSTGFAALSASAILCPELRGAILSALRRTTFNERFQRHCNNLHYR